MLQSVLENMKALLKSHGHRRTQSEGLSSYDDLDSPQLLKKLKAPLSYLRRRSVSDEKLGSNPAFCRFSVQEYRDAGVIYGTRRPDWTRNRRASYAFEGGEIIEQNLELCHNSCNCDFKVGIKEEAETEIYHESHKDIMIDDKELKKGPKFSEEDGINEVNQEFGSSEQHLECDRQSPSESFCSQSSFYNSECSQNGTCSEESLRHPRFSNEFSHDLKPMMVGHTKKHPHTVEGEVNVMDGPSIGISDADQSSIFSFQEDEKIGRNLSRKYYKMEKSPELTNDFFEEDLDDLDEDLNCDDVNNEFDDTGHLFGIPQFNSQQRQFVTPISEEAAPRTSHGFESPLNFDNEVRNEEIIHNRPPPSMVMQSMDSVTTSDEDKWHNPLKIHSETDLYSDRILFPDSIYSNSIYADSRQYISDEGGDNGFENLIDEANLVSEYYSEDLTLITSDSKRIADSLPRSRRLSSIIHLTESTITLFSRGRLEVEEEKEGLEDEEDEEELEFGSIESLNEAFFPGSENVVQGKSLTPISERSYDSDLSIK